MYDGATYFAWFVLTLLFLVVVALIVWLGSMPKKIAMRRDHPQVDAINACSWIGLALCGVGWPIAFVWAFLHAGPLGSETPVESAQPLSEVDKEIALLKQEIAELGQRLESTNKKGLEA